MKKARQPVGDGVQAVRLNRGRRGLTRPADLNCSAANPKP